MGTETDQENVSMALIDIALRPTVCQGVSGEAERDAAWHRFCEQEAKLTSAIFAGLRRTVVVSVAEPDGLGGWRSLSGFVL